jgi:hypothetical protein
VPAVCAAQHQSDTPAPTTLQERYDAMVTWLAEYQEWEDWIAKWGNRVAFNTAGGIIKDRPQRPQPPEWLWEDCRSVLSADGKLGEACEVLEHWNDRGEFYIRQRRAVVVTAKEAEPKSSFLQRIHLSAGWVPAQLPAPSVYLVAGMHVGVVEIGRATLPNVGVGLMAVDDGAGGYEWKPATVIGIGYRITSFAFPAIKRQANLHINVARATIHGASSVPVGFDPSQNLVGFSLTFAKK